jgi:hypothetical protein
MLGLLVCRHFNLRGMCFSDDTHHEGRAISEVIYYDLVRNVERISHVIIM